MPRNPGYAGRQATDADPYANPWGGSRRLISLPFFDNYASFSRHESPRLHHYLQPGDIPLVEGDTRTSTAINYLTRST
jgi:hypothetical protein